MSTAEIDKESIQLCRNIEKAAKAFIDSNNENQSRIMVFKSLNPELIKTILAEKLSQYNVTVKDYQIVPLGNLTYIDLLKDKITIVTAEEYEYIENLRYLTRDILVINFVYADVIDGSEIYIDLMVRSIVNQSKINTNMGGKL